MFWIRGQSQGHIRSERSNLTKNLEKSPIDRLYVVLCLLIPEYQGLLGWVGRYMYV